MEVHCPGSVLTTLFTGQVMVGALLSTTVTVNEHSVVLPEPSVDRHLTIVLPFGKEALLESPPSLVREGGGVQLSIVLIE
jgi:hypothetical protein